jgi:hypothetical protein
MTSQPDSYYITQEFKQNRKFMRQTSKDAQNFTNFFINGVSACNSKENEVKLGPRKSTKSAFSSGKVSEKSEQTKYKLKESTKSNFKESTRSD